jgi:hypothetical protein
MWARDNPNFNSLPIEERVALLGEEIKYQMGAMQDSSLYGRQDSSLYGMTAMSESSPMSNNYTESSSGSNIARYTDFGTDDPSRLDNIDWSNVGESFFAQVDGAPGSGEMTSTVGNEPVGDIVRGGSLSRFDGESASIDEGDRSRFENMNWDSAGTYDVQRDGAPSNGDLIDNAGDGPVARFDDGTIGDTIGEGFVTSYQA